MEIEVKGHSGCQIDVVREDRELYVYKSTVDPKYFNRLVLQAEKQRSATRDELQHIRVPRILDIVRNEKTVSVKMDYVYSRNFVEYFEQAGFEQIDYLIGGLKMFIEHEISHSLLTEVNRKVIIDKFDDVCSKTRGNKHLAGDHVIEDILNKSAIVFAALPESLSMPVGLCHGDLTFSNILFNGNNYYLIDFLDSFIESPLLDIVKLRQDTAWRWSQLMYVHPCDSIRLRIAFDKIDSELDRYFAGRYEWYRRFYHQLQLMNFLRILQYAHETAVIDYLKNVLNEQLKEF